MTIFISYGRKDTWRFARWLARRLQDCGYQVWIDLSNLKKGGLWEVRIEQGIRAASLVLALMSRHSLRERSICRDEVVFAINENKPVVPIRINNDPQVKPTLLLARRHWIDFSKNRAQALRTLLQFLSGDRSVLRAPSLPTVTGMVPLDFSPEIARFTTGFTGRHWLLKELDTWLNQPKGRLFVIVGEPGVGKSAIAAWLTGVRRERVVGIHFCTHRNTRTLNPFEFVASVVGQLSTQVSGFADEVSAQNPEGRRARASDAFRELVVEPARRLVPIPATVVILVDSLDEGATRDGETVVDVLMEQVEDLPLWLRIVATTRAECHILDRIRALDAFELRADSANNLADVAKYVQRRVQSKILQAKLRGAVQVATDRLLDVAEGCLVCAGS